MRVGLCIVGVVALAFSGCGDKRDGDEDETMDFPTGVTATEGEGDGGLKLDVEGGSGELDCQEGDMCDECIEQAHTPCDDGTTNLYNAIGLNCPGEHEVDASFTGTNQALGIRTGFGTTDTWAPREGTAYAVLGSGFIIDLDMETPPGDLDVGPRHCNDDLGDEWDTGPMLPAPLMINDVTGDCTMNPNLLGTGDCSNTINGQFSQGMVANDYTEVRIETTVPATNNSLSFDFAFFSTEYPWYFGQEYNDMFIGWLESESWTGNISFDEQGQPISLNAGFLDFRDDGGTVHPEFDGTCMKRHAGTKWLNTTAPVKPGERITLVWAIFDLADSILDSYVFVDNFHWGCDGTDRPSTTPVG